MTATKRVKLKIAPNSKESEMMVLGCMLTGINSLNSAADMLEELDFYFSEHRLIFKVLKSAYHRNAPADIHIVAEELKKIGKLEEAGGISYLTSLAQYVGTSAYVEEYAKIVKEKAILRQMIDAAQYIEKVSLEDPEDVYDVLDDAQSKFFAISQSANIDSALQLKELLSGEKAEKKIPFLKLLEERQEKYKQKGPEDPGITGIATHFIDLDKIINGMMPSNLVILAARPAMGKTALALNIAENICFKNNLPVAVFSLEMSAEQVLHRIISSQAEVEGDKIRTGALNGHEYQRIVSSVNSMLKHQLIIDDQPGLKITDLRARARRLKETHNISFLVIDYLQLISGSGSLRSIENRQNEISEISRMLKNLARELNIPVLCLAQLSRKVEERVGHRPMMSDLRESGCLTGDTIIEGADGNHYTIEQLSKRQESFPFFVFGIDNKLQLDKYRLEKAFYSGKKEVFELKTKKHKIKASSNHPFFKKESGWTRLDELKKGDFIATKNHSTIEFESIISITFLGEKDVYDATIESVHNFVANGIIVHNSIEQDADVVIFLLRREYYDSYDKPGQAELIIGKNRHGAVGSINLAYRKELPQFANFSSSTSALSEVYE